MKRTNEKERQKDRERESLSEDTMIQTTCGYLPLASVKIKIKTMVIRMTTLRLTNCTCATLQRVEFLRPDSAQVIERWHDRAIERSTDRSSDRAIERPSDRAAERTSDRATEQPSDRAIERPSDDRATERSTVIVSRAPEVHLTRWLVRCAAFFKTSLSNTLPMLVYRQN